MKTELKPCPFCGGKAALIHEDVTKCRSAENGDLITSWKVRCPECGTEQSGGITEYMFMPDETLKIISDNFNGREKAIKAWNRRATE